MLSSVSFLAGVGEWGLFTSGASSIPADPRRELATVHVAGLEQLLQFARVTMTSTLTQNPAEHVVVSAYPPFPAERIVDAVQRLLLVCAPAALTMVVQDRTGWAKAKPFAAASPESVAAAVAHTKITGGWDESDPIVIEVDALQFNVSGEFKNEAWHLVVRES
jgi:hypothetical protein